MYTYTHRVHVELCVREECMLSYVCVLCFGLNDSYASNVYYCNVTLHHLILIDGEQLFELQAAQGKVSLSCLTTLTHIM